jgi:hypothetical protein
MLGISLVFLPAIGVVLGFLAGQVWRLRVVRTRRKIDAPPTPDDPLWGRWWEQLPESDRLTAMAAWEGRTGPIFKAGKLGFTELSRQAFPPDPCTCETGAVGNYEGHSPDCPIHGRR